MLVLAAIPDVQLQRLRRATATRFTFVHAGNWGETLAVIRSRPVEVAVVDPLLSGEARALEIERLRLLFPSLPLILYTSLTPQLASVLLVLGQCGIRHVVFSRFDDHPTRLLQDPGFTIEDVAQRLGYMQVKTLQQHARTYLGLTAGEMRLSLAPVEALEVVVRRFLRPSESLGV